MRLSLLTNSPFTRWLHSSAALLAKSRIYPDRASTVDASQAFIAKPYDKSATPTGKAEAVRRSPCASWALRSWATRRAMHFLWETLWCIPLLPMRWRLHDCVWWTCPRWYLNNKQFNRYKPQHWNGNRRINIFTQSKHIPVWTHSERYTNIYAIISDGA